MQRTVWLGIFHCVCLSVYLTPILKHTFTTQQDHKYELNRVAVLDESHIMSEANRDINGDSTLETIFTNDYWGRPMNSPSSHKSWRPLTVLSFRWLTASGTPAAAYQLLVHRLFNVFTHAALADLVGGLAVELVKGFIPGGGSQSYVTLLYVLTKALFTLHPTHVEATANAANRNHLLSPICAVLLANPDLPWWLFLVALAGGYLCSETFIFTMPGVVITLTMVILSKQLFEKQQEEKDGSEKEKGKQKQDDDNKEEESEAPKKALWVTVIIAVLPRLFLMLFVSFSYLGARFYLDWLNIPEGLIRPAENPFYRLEGWTRFRSYFYVLAIEIAKSWSLDFIGFSHEYGHACILPVKSWDDLRFIATVVIGFQLGAGLLIGLVAAYFMSRPLISALILMQLAWLLTFFPLAGLVKVGTFISDRMAIPASVCTTMILGVLFTSLILPQDQEKEQQPATSKASKGKKQQSSTSLSPASIATSIFVVFLLAFQWSVIHRRTMEWMGWIPLLHSSLKTCPKFAKAHLELSKISNGLYMEEFNLTKSRFHVEQAETYDPNFCDVHQQYAQISIQENKYLEFEERLSKAVTCTFTTSGSADLWQRYWKMTLDPQQNPGSGLQAAQQRYQGYMKEIQKAIDAETAKQEEEERLKLEKPKSPFFWAQK